MTLLLAIIPCIIGIMKISMKYKNYGIIFYILFISLLCIINLLHFKVKLLILNISLFGYIMLLLNLFFVYTAIFIKSNKGLKIYGILLILIYVINQWFFTIYKEKDYIIYKGDGYILTGTAFHYSRGYGEKGGRLLKNYNFLLYKNVDYSISGGEDSHITDKENNIKLRVINEDKLQIYNP